MASPTYTDYMSQAYTFFNECGGGGAGGDDGPIGKSL